MTRLQLSQSEISMRMSNKTTLKLRKRKALCQIEKRLETIKSLEDDLTVQVERLNQAKRAKRTFGAHLEMERSSPIAALSEEIRAFISPAPVTINASDFIFSFLDGDAEVALKMSDDDKSKSVELGCFFKDGGASVKLLQALLLGNIDTNIGENPGPFPLRDSLLSIIFHNSSRDEIFIQATELFFKIDTVARSVRKLELDSICVVNSDSNGNVTLSISMSHEGVVVQITFFFDNMLLVDWSVTTVPKDVQVAILSTENDLTLLAGQLQEQAQCMLAESTMSDPVLLIRICDRIMESFQ